MKADPSFMLVAKIMLGVFVALGFLSVMMAIRVLIKKPEASPTKLAAAKRSLLFSSWILIPACGTAINAVITQQYWLLFASALLFSYVLPVIILYLRVRAALKSAGRPA